MNQRRAAADLASATISESDGVRYLHLGTPWVQGAMRLRKPLALELEYVQRMMAWLLLRPLDDLPSAHAVQLGLGAGSITRFCHAKLHMRTSVVEINPEVIGACRAWFRLPHAANRLEVLQMDAADYVADPAHAGSADALCVDLYDHDAASPVLDSEDFYRGCRRLLADGGVASVNLFGRDASFARSAERIAAAFGAERMLSLRPTREGNTIVLACKDAGWPDRSTLLARADAIESRFGLPARKWLRMIRPLPAPSE
jgi:spermidine synthase